MGPNNNIKIFLVTTLIFWCNVVTIASGNDLMPPPLMAAAEAEAEALQKFKDSLENNTGLSSWVKGTHPCDDKTIWKGIICDEGKVWGLKLQNMGLKGKIDVVALMGLPELRTISIMDNNLEGPLPDIGQLTLLKTIYLSNNNFSGLIPGDVFSKMLSLKKLYLSENQFTGPIPASLTLLPKLVELNLEGNQFDGPMPVFQERKWFSFNVSNNKLEGQIPESLSEVDASSFSGESFLLEINTTIITQTFSNFRLFDDVVSVLPNGDLKHTVKYLI